MEALCTWKNMSFLNFPVGGTSCLFLRQYFVHDCRSLPLGWMDSRRRLPVSCVRDEDWDARALEDMGWEDAQRSLHSTRTASLNSPASALGPLPPGCAWCYGPETLCFTCPQSSPVVCRVGGEDQGISVFCNSLQAIILILAYPSALTSEVPCPAICRAYWRCLFVCLINRIK